jgi:hypothetical protein
MSLRLALIAVLAVVALASPAHAGHPGFLSEPGGAGFSPQVPLSAFARPASWFDPSRLQLQSTMSVGSGFGGSGTSALAVTKLSYQFRAPLALSVSLGNTFGFDKARNGGSQFFLEGFDLTWRPSANATFRVEMHDVRSPLQYGFGSGYGPGRADPFSTPY